MQMVLDDYLQKFGIFMYILIIVQVIILFVTR